MEALCGIIISNALIVTVMAITVALLGRVWKNPHALHFLWVIVLAKFLLPPIVWISVPWPTPDSADRPTTDDKSVNTSVHPTVDLVVAKSATPSSAQGTPQEDVYLNSDSTSRAHEINSIWPGRVSLRLIAACLWVAGSIGVAIYVGIEIVRFHRCLRFSHPASPEIVEAAKSIGRQLGLRRIPEIAMMPFRLSPLVWAIGCKVRVILPTELCQRLTPAALESILAHELTHIKRNDHVIRFLELLTTTLFWWHPVTWWAANRLRELEEECCDAFVIRATSCDAKSYATALIDTLEFLSAEPIITTVAATTAHPMVSLTRRIKMLRVNAYAARMARSHVLLLAALGGIPAAVAFAVVPANETVSSPSDPVAAQRDSAVQWRGLTEFRGVVLDQKQQPIAGAQIVLADAGDGAIQAQSFADTTSNEQGDFILRIGVDRAQSWNIGSTGIIWVQADGYSLGTKQVHPCDPSHAARCEVTLEPSKTTELTVLGPDGKPLRGAVTQIQVFHHYLPKELMKLFPAKIDEQGRLTLRGLPCDPNDMADPRSIWIRTRDFGLQEFTWWHQADPAPVKQVALTARPLTTIRGKLYGAKGPLADDILGDVDVTFETLFGDSTLTPGNSWCRGFATARTDSKGRFQVEIAAGKLMSVNAHLGKETKLRAMVPGREILWEPGTLNDLWIPLYPTRTLRGEVRHPSGAPAVMGFAVTHGNLVRENNGDQVMTRGAFHETFYTDASGNVRARSGDR